MNWSLDSNYKLSVFVISIKILIKNLNSMREPRGGQQRQH